MTGTIYLLHMEKKLAHSQHYIGYANGGMEAVERRIAQHECGRGSPMLRAAREADISWELVRTWRGTRSFERSLKNRKNARQLCPCCIEEYREGDRNRKAKSKEVLICG